MIYDDLLNIPYKEGGRDSNGIDCYGIVLECCKRNGTELNNVLENKTSLQEKDLSKYRASFNVKEIEMPKAGCVVQCVYFDEIHIGFMIDKKTCIHATKQGVRISPVIALKNKKYYEVIK